MLMPHAQADFLNPETVLTASLVPANVSGLGAEARECVLTRSKFIIKAGMCSA